MDNIKKLTVKRPWGFFERFCLNTRCTVKLLKIKPNEELSLQIHNKRKEFWKIVNGSGYAILGIRKFKVKKDDEIRINPKQKHKLIEFMEISLGTFDEKDEVRLEDKYNRK